MKSYHFDYNRTYNPPAPVISVRLRSSRGGISALLPAFVDSGADATMVPVAFLEQIRAPFEDTRNLIGVTGLRRSVRLYAISVQIGTDIIYGIDAVGYGEEIVLGRDVLNQLTVILEGPLHTCELRI